VLAIVSQVTAAGAELGVVGKPATKFTIEFRIIFVCVWVFFNHSSRGVVFEEHPSNQPKEVKQERRRPALMKTTRQT